MPNDPINKSVKKPWAIDESTIVTETFQIPDGYLPKGLWWDEDGACYAATECEGTASEPWYWAARNTKALEKGYNGQKLLPFFLPKDIKL